MKFVNVEINGRKERMMIRDTDDVADAMEIGVPSGIPSVDLIDWELVKTELHNALFSRGLFGWDDVIRQQNALTSISKMVLKKHLVDLYKGER